MFLQPVIAEVYTSDSFCPYDQQENSNSGRSCKTNFNFLRDEIEGLGCGKIRAYLNFFHKTLKNHQEIFNNYFILVSTTAGVEENVDGG